MADKDKFKKRIRAGRVPGVAGVAAKAGAGLGRKLYNEIPMGRKTKMKAQPGGERGTSSGRIKMPKGSAAGDIMGAPWYETPEYKEPDHPGGGEYDWSKELEEKKDKKPRYGYRGTANPKTKKKKPKKKIPKTKKRIKGTLRDNLPIFGGPGRVPEG